MNKTFLHILLLFCSCAVFAQVNLVPNGSFEDITDCPTGADIEKSVGWFSPNEATPDLFNQCTNILLNYSVPSNAFGFQTPKEGNGYAGIVTYANNSNAENVYREYLSIQLKETLKKGEIYIVTFFVSLSDISPFATNNIGYAFTESYLYQNNPFQLNLNPFYCNLGNIIIEDTSNWIKVESIYIGDGVENYLVIGNFENDAQTTVKLIQQSPSDVFYFVDNVSVVDFQYDFPNVFTPNDDGLNDYIDFGQLSGIIDLELTIYNRWGNLVFSYTGTGNSIWDGKNNSDGIYFYVLKIKEYHKKGFIHLMR